MEMRLGKNLVVIRRVALYKPLSKRQGIKVLVVCPSSAFLGWSDDLKLEGIRPNYLTGSRAERLEVLGDNDANWFLINKEGWKYLPEIADPSYINWDVVCVDESTCIRNPQAKITKFFLKNFRDVPHRIILTGTPNPESHLEFWSQMAFLDGGFLGCKNYWDFRAKYFEPEPFGFGWVPKPGTLSLINVALKKRCYILKRTDAGVEKHVVPEKRVIEMPKHIRELYDKIENEYAISDTVSTKWAITKHTWLRQLCCGFCEDKLVWDAKVQELKELLTGELAGEQVVVWFPFNPPLFECEHQLREAKISCAVIWGGVEVQQRMEITRQFRLKNYRVLLIQVAVGDGGQGLDLSCCDTAIYYGEPDSRLHSDQSKDRIIKADKDTSLLHIFLMAKNTVDEDVHEALAEKRSNSNMATRLKELAMKRRAS